MQQFLCIHTFGPGMLNREQVQQFAQAVQQAEEVRGVHSYVNLTEGKAACILEAESKGALKDFFQKNGMPVDSICPVEMEGDRTVMHDVAQQAAQAAMGESMGRRQD